MKLEEELPDAMRDTVSGVRPDVAALVAGGIERGRRDSRRARIAQLVGTGAVVALVGGLAIALPLSGSPKPADQQVAGTTQVVTPTPTTKPAAPAPRVKTTSQALLQQLLDELPEGAKTGTYGGITHPTWIDAQLLWTTPKGDSRVSVSLTFDGRTEPDSGWDKDACDQRSPEDQDEFCSVESFDDGSWLLLEKTDYPDGRKDQLYTAVFTRADNVVVSLTASGTEQLAPPHHTIAELAKLVRSPVWQPKVDQAFADAAAKRFGELPTDPMHPESGDTPK
ncbi:hypothetical protein [Tenggerimyces flavus]|uniref:Uncharacterized protein n=1 Tax=Tenggerimyces flavus TaxID=1708749 RepID=A0ABV7Y4B3_9ACTN|nr:hypothetical protein [Tenggerimyces flavus]MBM7790513.1 hypothetical protein [Tenggerimyces flavus]